MSGGLEKFGPKVKYFSNTAGTGATGLLNRVKGWAVRGKKQLAGTAYRKAFKAVSGKNMPFAQAIHIEVTNACNLECPMCPQPAQERPIGRMPKELFSKIIAQLKPHRRILEGVALMGLGEPLLHNNLEIYSRIAKDAGLPNVYTSTNATLVDEKRAESLLQNGAFDRIIFSVDGINPETFSKLRKGADHDVVYGNIERFLELKKKIHRSPVATLQILVMSETMDELEDFCEHWVPLLGPGDEIMIKHVDTFGGLVSDRRTDPESEPEHRYECRQLWKDMSISWDGRVTVCCKDVFYKLEIGNVSATPLAELWKSGKWNAIRDAHQRGNFGMAPCGDCREWYI